MIALFYRKVLFLILTVFFLSAGFDSFSQPAYFIDGYHGGIYGHLPSWQTRFMVDKLNQFPDWKINLELEPESWDTIEKNDARAYGEFKEKLRDQSAGGPVEYINPTYGQSYLYTISGESIIRQFFYGMKKLQEHFPGIVFTTYSSEEPCYTSALPQILKSYGFKYASLKNPNTCWGGYTRAFGGEVVNWIGPDGSKIITVPRYEIELLKPGSTWETIAGGNSVEYIKSALNDGIIHPVGMCLQDAGWSFGPWLNNAKNAYTPSVYTTWRNYFENVAVKSVQRDWQFSQEDVLVSLMWGSQVLQKIAQQVRGSENKIITAEKLAAMSKIYKGLQWPKDSFDKAWRTLLLSQHHDCWIVPYNGTHDNTWADKVARWTAATNQYSDSIIKASVLELAGGQGKESGEKYIRVFNTLGIGRSEWVKADFPKDWGKVTILDSHNKELVSQEVENVDPGKEEIIFKATVPPLGYNTYHLLLRTPSSAREKGAAVSVQKNGKYLLETDLYRILVNPSKGGIIESLIAKKLNNKEFADQSSVIRFNELRGNFYDKGGFCSGAQNPAIATIIENGPVRVKIQMKGVIADNPFIQTITVTQGQERIDFSVRIDWKGNPGIGEFRDDARANEARKAFYDDRFKLLVLFPLNLPSQRVYKNAPFDVTESKLDNTFFNRWDSIKNNIILNWVDVTDAKNDYGLALFTDHTTSYTHGRNFPLGLTLQYSGNGLFFRNYTINGPSEINYALIPHLGRWDKSGIWTEGTKWNEPLMTGMVGNVLSERTKSLITPVSGSGWEISSVTMDGNDLLIR
jgi:alpha-mannosidase